MRLNLDLSKVEGRYTREVFRQILDTVGSTKFLKFINDHVTSKQVKGELVLSTAGSADVTPLQFTPKKDSEAIYVDGLRVFKGVGNDYTINYATGVITFQYAMTGSELIVVDYVK